MNNLRNLTDLSNTDSLEISLDEINLMITHYVQDGAYDLSNKSDVEAFIETYLDEECISLHDVKCCSDTLYSLSCEEIKENSVVIKIESNETKNECICDNIEAMVSLIGGV